MNKYDLMMVVQAPVLGSFVVMGSSDTGSLPEPATEMTNMQVSEAQLQSGYSSSENRDDDCQPPED